MNPGSTAKLQNASARIPKSTEDYQNFPHQRQSIVQKRTNSDHFEWPRRQHSIQIIRNLFERI